jgi:hypothetical protein
MWARGEGKASMAIEPKESKKLGVVDTVLISGAVVGGILVVLWILRAVVGVALFAFKIVMLVIVVAVLIRLVHFFTRTKD